MTASAGGEPSYWIRVECAFKCRSCGFVVPLNHLDMDGAVLCARCGLEQAFEVDRWKKALELAHDAGEAFDETLEANEGLGLRTEIVASLEREGIVSPAEASIHVTLAGENRLAVVASPGSPRCDACHGPLALTFASGEGGPATVSCAACQTSAVYETPDAALRMNGGALRAALVTEHRTDRAAVKTTGAPGGVAIAIQCPSCGGPLPATQKTRFAECPHCRTVSRIPDRTWFQLSGEAPASEPMWLHFRGHSRLYAEVVKKRRDAEVAEQDRKARSAAAWAATQAREQAERRDAQRKKEASLSFELGRWLRRWQRTLLVLLIVGGILAAASVALSTLR